MPERSGTAHEHARARQFLTLCRARADECGRDRPQYDSGTAPVSDAQSSLSSIRSLSSIFPICSISETSEIEESADRDLRWTTVSALAISP
ncbi:hypothetical protein [Streptomyces sp. bgisy022]|uniref:hypothetical protein n=1 Tax=Streptomyces sp. bgisy022 TaxID=3413769 RepID=UPI003D740FE8